jgi:hypothetical protein
MGENSPNPFALLGKEIFLLRNLIFIFGLQLWHFIPHFAYTIARKKEPNNGECFLREKRERKISKASKIPFCIQIEKKTVSVAFSYMSSSLLAEVGAQAGSLGQNSVPELAKSDPSRAVCSLEYFFVQHSNELA